MSDPSFSVVLLVTSDDSGNELVYNWRIFDLSSGTPVPVTDASGIKAINIMCGTTDPEGAPVSPINFFGRRQLTVDGALVSTATNTGLVPQALYTNTISVYLDDASGRAIIGTVLTATVKAVVRGRIQDISPQITGADGDEQLTIFFDASSAQLCEARMQNYDESGQPDPVDAYSQMYVAIRYNDGSGGWQTTPFPWGPFKLAGYQVTVTGLINDVSYEVWGYYGDTSPDIGGTSAPSNNNQGIVLIPTNRPNPPDVADGFIVVSTFDYNTNNSIGGEYSITDASTVTILFNNPRGQDPTTDYYTVWRQDLSSNGYTPVRPAFIIDPSVSFTDVSNTFFYGGNGFAYRTIDTGARPGTYSSYYITGTNENGTGVPSVLLGVLDGAKASEPTISGESTDQAVSILFDVSNVNRGGFQPTPEGYVVGYYPDLSGSSYIQYTDPSTQPVLVTGLTNTVAYTFIGYYSSANNQYTSVGAGQEVDGSAIPIGPNNLYLSRVSNAVTVTPFVAPTTPTNVVVSPVDQNNDPSGTVFITWSSPSTFDSQQLFFEILRTDPSGGAPANIPGTPNPMILDLSGGLSPTPQAFNDIAVDRTLGIQYNYQVRSAFTVGQTTVYSLYSAAAGPVTPFVEPEVPGVNGAFINGTEVSFSLNYTGKNGGGLQPVIYQAAITDVSGRPLRTVQGVSAEFVDISLNTVYAADISANTLCFLTYAASVFSVDTSMNYYSPVVPPQLIGKTVAIPVITNVFTDPSSILHIQTINNGAPLNFAEAIVIDVSSNLNLAYSTDPSAGSMMNNVVVQSNNDDGAAMTVNFSNPLIPPNQAFDPLTDSPANTLIVVTNSFGGVVYDALPN